MKKRLLLLLTLSALTLAITSCGSENTNNTSSENQTTDSSTTTVTDVRGELEIPASPSRVVDLSGSSDVLTLLGYNIVGTANSDAYDYTKYPSYLEDMLGNAQILGYSMVAEMDVEAILALEPDLIVISTIQEKMYDQLSEIAPVVMVDLALVDWKEDMMNVANTFNKGAEAEAWINDYLAYAEEIGNEVKSTYGEETTYLSYLASAGSLYLFDSAGLGTILYEDMQLARPENMPGQANVSLPVVTIEGLVEIDADYQLVVATDADLQTLKDNSVWNNVEAIKNGNYVELPASPYFNIGYSPIGRMVFLEEIQTLLEGANE